MRLLLDTHAVLWWLSDDVRLGSAARDLIEDPANDILVSTVSLWEIVVKARIGKLDANISDIMHAIDDQAFDMLDIRPTHLIELARLPAHHRDPFDHLLIAQCVAENLTFLSEDQHVPAYAIPFIACSDCAGSAPGRR